MHWDIGSTILSHPLPTDMGDGYIELSRATGFSYGITVARGGLSARHHERSDLLFYLHTGSARFNIGEKTFQASIGDAIYVPRGAIYTALNTGSQPLQLVTIYSPPLDRKDIVYHESDDSRRREVAAPPGK